MDAVKMLRNIFLMSILCCMIEFSTCNPNRKTGEILDALHRIEEVLAKEERLREIADIVRIDSTIDKLNKKMDRLVAMLEQNRQPPATVRSDGSTSLIPRDLTSTLEAIDSRLHNLEIAVDKVEESFGRNDPTFQKIEEIERRTTQLKDDMNQKMRKMMNVMTALYEMNKDIKVNFGSRSIDAPEPKQDAGSSYSAEFLIENLEELERKIKEQFSVLTSEIRNEMISLKIVASTMGDQCNPSSQSEDEDEWLTPSEDNARSVQKESQKGNSQTGRSAKRVEDTLDNLVESLGKTTKEIREEIQQGMQGIDYKLNNLTVIAATQPQCDHLDTSESVINSRRSAESLVRAPQQSLDEKQQPRSESCTKTARNVVNPKSCSDLMKGGANCDGIYVIFPKGLRAVRVFCDMTTNGGGWTVLMRRGDYGEKMTSFHKNWISYKNGFGDSEGEFWLGNDVMNLMTSEEDNMLRVHLSASDGDLIDLDYSSFSVANETAKYRLHIGAPMGLPSAAANSLRYHNNHPFSTFDKKNDGFDQNCAATYKGGWWFNGCYFGFLTGEYFRPEDKRENWQGILWYDWKGNSSLKGAEMLIRPKNFTATA